VYWLESGVHWVSDKAQAVIKVYVSNAESRTALGFLNGSSATVVAEAVLRQMVKEEVGQSIADLDEVSAKNLLAMLAEIGLPPEVPN
jgi:hypothetical protein